MSTADNRRERARSWVIGLVLVGFGAFATVFWLNRKGEVVGWNQTIQYDDFAFEVTDVRPQTLAGTTCTVISMNVHNRAVRVDYRFRRDIVVIEDADGNFYRVSPKAQAELDRLRGEHDPCGKSMPAGTSCSTELAFALPEQLSDPQLLIRHGGWIGALADDLLFGRKAIRLKK